MKMHEAKTQKSAAGRDILNDGIEHWLTDD
jgi:hypothetical protein